MNPWSVLGRIHPKNLLRGLFLGLGHPLYVGPTIRATRACVRIATDLYGRLHHKNGPANAFRHALWNYMIAEACSPGGKGREKAIAWAEKITRWHEEAFPNRQLARDMDLHNNALGREILRSGRAKDREAAIRLLVDLAKESVPIEAGTDLRPLKDKMVHLIAYEN